MCIYSLPQPRYPQKTRLPALVEKLLKMNGESRGKIGCLMADMEEWSRAEEP